jgi:hypothetical protein
MTEYRITSAKVLLGIESPTAPSNGSEPLPAVELDFLWRQDHADLAEPLEQVCASIVQMPQHAENVDEAFLLFWEAIKRKLEDRTSKGCTVDVGTDPSTYKSGTYGHPSGRAVLKPDDNFVRRSVLLHSGAVDAYPMLAIVVSPPQ